MGRLSFKLFRNNARKFVAKPFDMADSYYSFLKQMNGEGLTQFLLTSDTMINLLLSFLHSKNNHLVGITLYDDDDIEAKEHITKLFKAYEDGLLDEDDIHFRLDYLESEHSIDLDAISIRNDDYGVMTIRSNGVFDTYRDDWVDIVLCELTKAWNQ
ncbi:hypothetical protein lacNasYZ03_18330 [Lactobacillus nasalidis]|uniref:Uncharacterized protein n=1 Tax=Lactobacillus nasalidis TaxID=2797258 RepID=A0ABQ3W6F6_9LACO|nr:hypothetical protein [Lactobacillus nasalidis]GHV98075.1 hypothetical protein lacNasYZ01_12570 [Lactobacillus nasalidis]GHV99714.1 hypothetical protein lacNasYZ02_11440 [Lactobacillus nasalidis]GHW02146.1 hypothetical protein lacNasYZ03_18330 [Lactobacillus nasalidis]